MLYHLKLAVMELLYPSLLLSLLSLLLIHKFITTCTRRTKLPPGPWQLPIIGSVHHMIGGLPHRRMRELSRVHGPIMHLKLGEVTTIVVSSAEAAREIFKTHDITFSSRPLYLIAKVYSTGNSFVFAPHGELWRQMRKITVLELLSNKRVRSFRYIREEEVSSLVRSIASCENQVINLSQRLIELSNDITTRAVMGDKCKEQAAFLKTMDESFEASGGREIPDLFPSSSLLYFFSLTRLKLQKINGKQSRILDNIIKDHRQRQMEAVGNGQLVKEDLIDVLLRIQAEDNLGVPFTDNLLKAIILEIFGAGTETSTTSLGWILTELVRSPRAMEKAQLEVRGVLDQKGRLTEEEVAELSYMKLVIKEAMRLHLPVPLIPRECAKACEVLGYEIPEKARLIVNAWAIARDKQYWGGDAEEFRPERFNGNNVDFGGSHYEFIPFGAGRRMCPGLSFALPTMEVVLAHLLCYFDWKLPGNADPNDMDMDETFGATTRRKSDLYLHAIPRVPISNLATCEKGD